MPGDVVLTLLSRTVEPGDDSFIVGSGMAVLYWGSAVSCVAIPLVVGPHTLNACLPPTSPRATEACAAYSDIIILCTYSG